MQNTMEQRFYNLRNQIEGFRIKKDYEDAFGPTREEQMHIRPVNAWHRRIISELEFCLQMKEHSELDVSQPVVDALTVLETAQAKDGVLTDAVCEEAEKCLLPLSGAARTYKLVMVGHAHLDMNWMWAWDETVATVVATFRTILKLMREYPKFCFSQSQASTYQIIEEYAPELMPEIQERIREGRWEVTASAWVETDKNMPCLESLMNHIVYTKKYLEEHWGVDPASLDLDFSPDTFGHSAFLPELDALGGVKYYYHCRGLADTDYVLYRWQAPSGKEILMYREPYWYNSAIVPETAIGLPRMASMCAGLRTGMAVYGVGDHGGGPTRRDLNRALEMMEWPVFPELKFGTLHDYFAEAETVREQLKVVDHELNAIFTGCYTTQSKIKRGNRRAETALANAETLSAMANPIGMAYPERSFEKAWQKVLFTHFHDILTGSCVPDSREYAMGLYQDAIAMANSKAALAMEQLAGAIDTSAIACDCEAEACSEGAGVGYGVTSGQIPTSETGVGLTRILHVVNTTGSERYENANLTIWDWPGDLSLLTVTDAEGNELEFERTTDIQFYWSHAYFNLLVKVKVPAYGYTTVILKQKAPTSVTNSYLRKIPYDLHHSPHEDFVLENAYLCARFDKRTGEVYSVIDKCSGTERLQNGKMGGLRYVEAQKEGMSAWVIGCYTKISPLSDLVKLTPLAGKLESGFEAEYRVGNSKIKSKVTLGAEDKFLKICIHADWKEESYSQDKHPLLVYSLPLTDATGRMLCDVPGGAVWRQEQELDVPCLNYGAAEFGDGRVLALASDCKYAFRLSGGELFATLISAGSNPDPYPEYGMHDITLFMLVGDADVARLTAQAEICQKPLQYVTNTSHPGELPLTKGFFGTNSESVVISGVALRDGCLAVRMYETKGNESLVTIACDDMIREAAVTDLLGNPLGIEARVVKNEAELVLNPYQQAELRIKM